MQVIVKFNRGIPELSEDLRNAYRTFGNDQALITIEKLPMSHSKAQRNYFHSIIVEYYRKLWMDVKGNFHKNIVKAMIKSMFLKEEIICEISGEITEIVKDTRDLSVSEYDEFIQLARLWYQHETGDEIPFVPYYRGKERG